MRGPNKLLLEVDGRPLVRRTLDEIRRVPFHEVIVVTGAHAEAVRSACGDAWFVHNAEHARGMHASIKAGVRALDACDAFFVCLADQPRFDHRTLLALMEGEGLTAPVFDGRRGHPVLIPAKHIPEILAHPDGDHGCAYLFDRHPLSLIEIADEGVVVDVDTPADYARYTGEDPLRALFEKTVELRATGRPFVQATVIEVIGSASARVGAKALFDERGRNVLGYVGGGCAERFIGEQAVSAIAEGRPRTVLADLDDEIFGLGVACGGQMRVFLDVVMPLETMPLPPSRFVNETRALSGFYGWSVVPSEERSPETIEEFLLGLSHAAAARRGRTHRPLREVKASPARFTPSALSSARAVTIVGRTRITEALARHFALLSYDVRAIGPDVRAADYPASVQCSCLDEGYGGISFRPGEVVVIASHTAQDPEIARRALAAGAAHVAVIGSRKRAEEVLSFLGLKGRDVSEPLFIPAGLDIDARNPDEIALSVVAEVLARGT